MTSPNTSPASGAVAITPDDANNITACRGIYVAATGALKVDMINGDTVTFTAIAAGVVHPLQLRRVYATGTTATGVIALY